MKRSTKPNRVVQSNALTTASYKLTLVEKQILLLAVAKVRDCGESLDPSTPVVVSALDLVEIFGADPSNAYKYLKSATELLYERSVTIDRPDPDNPKLRFTRTRWVAALDHFPTEGRISLFFSPKVLPYLTNLAREFTAFQLQHTTDMTSVYAIRIYELLCQWRRRGELEVTLDWLRERFNLPESYDDVRRLKSRVIVPAIEQINAHSDLWVKWEQHKRGRVVHAMTFTFGPKAEQKPEAESRPASPANSKPAKPKLTRAYVERHAQPGESWEEAWERCRRQLEQETAG